MQKRTVPYFVGRTAELTRLHQDLGAGEVVDIWSVKGMGGIGKSELALQYLYRYQDSYPDGILWLDATSATLAEESIGFGIGALQLDIAQELPPQQKIQAVWANWQGTDPVLVVLDNINTVEDFSQAKGQSPPQLLLDYCKHRLQKILKTLRQRILLSVVEFHL